MNLDENILESKSPEVIKILAKIYEDRGFLHQPLYDTYISDELIMYIMMNCTPSKERDDFIRDFTKFNSYRTILDIAYREEKIDQLYTLDPSRLVRHMKRSGGFITKEDMIKIMYAYTSRDLDIPSPIVCHYLYKTMGAFWFLYGTRPTTKIIDELWDTIMNLYGVEILLKVMYAFYTALPNDKSLYLQYNSNSFPLSFYYGRGGKFIHTSSDDFYNIISYITWAKEYKDEISTIVPVTIAKNACTSTYSDLKEEFKEFALSSLKHNANNINLLFWVFGEDEEVPVTVMDKITEDIIHSEVPLMEFGNYVSFYRSVNNGVDVPRDILIEFIKHGYNISSVLEYTLLQPFVIPMVLYGSIADLVEVLEDDYRIVNEVSLHDYIVSDIIRMLHSNTAAKVIDALMYNNKTWSHLSTESRMTLLSMIDVYELAIRNPSTLSIRSVTDIIPEADIIRICYENHDALYYLPPDKLPPEVLIEIVAKYGYHKLDDNTQLTTLAVYNMIQRKCGYGYIFDLPTTLQVDTLIRSILKENRI